MAATNLPEALVASETAAPGRACGSCSMCCKLLPIRELEKPENTWCVHCKPGAADPCTIYADRPASCRGFMCHWLISPALGDEWYPGKSRMFVHYNHDPLGNVGLYIIVDPGRPDAWRREPYLSQLKVWAFNNLRARKMRTYVNVGARTYLMMPDGAVETTGKFHHVVAVGPDRFEARLYDSREEAMRAKAAAR